ncbi:hypothetical protein [Dyella sp. C11]|uniref:hypothetical protein n=1 Tax=Dyella sp. C11 TaxID=2126991 RepID=UPI000D6504D0|nr:hypothetical protein [Dyella sp. C11]
MNRPGLFFSLGIVAIAVVATTCWLIVRHPREHRSLPTTAKAVIAVRKDDLPALPPAGAPLEATYELLRQRAGDGDPVAAQRVFDGARECMIAARLDAFYQHALQDKHWILNQPESPDASAWDKQYRESTIQAIQQGMERVQRDIPNCGSFFHENLDDGRMLAMALAAARTGDDQATACLMTVNYKGRSPSPEENAAFAQEVMRLANDGMQRGSWQIVEAMREVVGSRSVEGGQLTPLSYPDQAKSWAYARLYRLGLPDDSPAAIHMDKVLSEVSTTSPAEQAKAQEWAQGIYQRYFIHSGPAQPDAIPCEY